MSVGSMRLAGGSLRRRADRGLSRREGHTHHPRHRLLVQVSIAHFPSSLPTRDRSPPFLITSSTPSRVQRSRPHHSSCLLTVHRRATDPLLAALAHCDWASSLYAPLLHTFWTRFFGGDFSAHGKRVFSEHYAHVRAVVPPERLLEYRVGADGWGPLCAFLGVEVPRGGREVPRVNEAEGFVRRCGRRNRAQVGNVVVRVLVWLVVLGGGVGLAAVVNGARYTSLSGEVIRPGSLGLEL